MRKEMLDSHNLYTLGVMGRGYRHITSNTPIESVDDIAKLTIDVYKRQDRGHPLLHVRQARPAEEHRHHPARLRRPLHGDVRDGGGGPKLFKIGRLQFQMYKAPMGPDYTKLPFKRGDNLLYIHIPQGEKLTRAVSYTHLLARTRQSRLAAV